jgi:hypothetical protein
MMEGRDVKMMMHDMMQVMKDMMIIQKQMLAYPTAETKMKMENRPVCHDEKGG